METDEVIEILVNYINSLTMLEYEPSQTYPTRAILLGRYFKSIHVIRRHQ